MGRIFNTLLLAIMIGGAIVTYSMKHKAELAAERVADLQHQVAKEKEAIQVLKAEWSVLDQPARLQSLVEHYADYFQLKTFTPDQLATIAEIPMRPIMPPVPEMPPPQLLAGSVTRTASASE